jgi:hypothetical protein
MNKLKEMSISELLAEYDRIANAKSPSFKDREKIAEVIKLEAATRPEYLGNGQGYKNKRGKETSDEYNWKDFFDVIKVKENGAYVVTVCMKEVGSSDDRKTAFQMCVREVLKEFKGGGLQLMLDQGCWVQFQDRIPLLYTDVRDTCYRNNWIKLNDKREVEYI